MFSTQRIITVLHINPLPFLKQKAHSSLSKKGFLQNKQMKKKKIQELDVPDFHEG